MVVVADVEAEELLRRGDGRRLGAGPRARRGHVSSAATSVSARIVAQTWILPSERPIRYQIQLRYLIGDLPTRATRPDFRHVTPVNVDDVW